MREYNTWDPRRQGEGSAGLPCALSKWEGAPGRRRLRETGSGVGETLVASPLSQWVSNGGIWQYLGTFWVVTTGVGRRVLLASDG